MEYYGLCPACGGERLYDFRMPGKGCVVCGMVKPRGVVLQVQRAIKGIQVPCGECGEYLPEAGSVYRLCAYCEYFRE